MKTLDALSDALPTATVYLARELTKMHETVHIGTAADLLSELEQEPVTQKGEFVVIVDCR